MEVKHTNLSHFMSEWFPKTTAWSNVRKFILESGVELTTEVNPKWLSGYTNIGMSHKPHHKDEYVRHMEESMFMLHDVVHNIFTLDTSCNKEEYVKRQIIGELITFYLTEWSIPNRWVKDFDYREDRGCYSMMICVLGYRPTHVNIVDHMWDVFIDNSYRAGFLNLIKKTGNLEIFNKCSRMFKEDMKNSKKNYKYLPKNIQNCCVVGPSSQNHVDFLEAVMKGSVKNIKREFNLILPDKWI